MTTKETIEKVRQDFDSYKSLDDGPYCVHVEWIIERCTQVAEVAKAERDKEILNLELELSDVAGSTKKYWMQLGVDRFKALLTPNKKEV